MSKKQIFSQKLRYDLLVEIKKSFLKAFSRKFRCKSPSRIRKGENITIQHIMSSNYFSSENYYK